MSWLFWHQQLVSVTVAIETDDSMIVMTTPVMQSVHKRFFLLYVSLTSRASDITNRNNKKKVFTLLTSHHLKEHSPSSPPSIHGTFIPQNLFSLSWLAAPFLLFRASAKFSSEVTVIVFHLGWRGGSSDISRQAGEGTENRGRGRGPRIRNQSTMMLRSAGLGMESISRFIISLHTFRCARSRHRSPTFLSRILKENSSFILYFMLWR